MTEHSEHALACVLAACFPGRGTGRPVPPRGYIARSRPQLPRADEKRAAACGGCDSSPPCGLSCPVIPNGRWRLSPRHAAAQVSQDNTALIALARGRGVVLRGGAGGPDLEQGAATRRRSSGQLYLPSSRHWSEARRRRTKCRFHSARRRKARGQPGHGMDSRAPGPQGVPL